MEVLRLGISKRLQGAKRIHHTAILNKGDSLNAHYRLADGNIAEEWIVFGLPVLYVFTPEEVRERLNRPLSKWLL